MLYVVLIAVVLAIGLFAVYIAMKSPEFTVTRSAKMSAPPANVFAQINNFHNWEAWSPWAKMDPNAKNAFEGPASGEGAKFSWQGNKDIGEGAMTITESRPSDVIKIDLEFFKPFAARNLAVFTFTPIGDETEVKWTMTGQSNFFCRAMCTFMNMDKMVGGQFEKGLAAIREIVESPRETTQLSTTPNSAIPSY